MMYTRVIDKSAQKQIGSTFGGIKRTPGASSVFFNKADNISTEHYPVILCGAKKILVEYDDDYGNVTSVAQLWNNVYDEGSYIIGDCVIVSDGTKKLRMTYSDHGVTSIKSVNVSGDITRVGRYFYDISAKRMYQTRKKGGSIEVKTTNLTDEYTFSESTRLDNSKDGVLVITITTNSKTLKFEKGDSITLECDDWSDNSIREDCSCFMTRDAEDGTSNAQACTYLITDAKISSASHIYTCEAVGCNGGMFASPYNTVYFGNTYAYIKIAKRFPELDCMCLFNNRVAGGSSDGKMIMMSALGSGKDFYDFSGEESDSYYTNVETVGRFEGITEYNNTLVAFKRNCIHVLYGSMPSEFQLAKTIHGVGCIDKSSVCECNGLVYFLSDSGFCSYGGGAVTVLENRFDKKIVHAKCCACGSDFYALVKYENDKGEILKYDTRIGLWTSVDVGMVVDIFTQNGRLFVTDGKFIYRVDTNGGKFELESMPIYGGDFGMRAMNRLRLRAIMDERAYIDIYTKEGDRNWIFHKRLIGNGICEYSVPIALRAGFNYSVSLRGVGRVAILKLEYAVIGEM